MGKGIGSSPVLRLLPGSAAGKKRSSTGILARDPRRGAAATPRPEQPRSASRAGRGRTDARRRRRPAQGARPAAARPRPRAAGAEGSSAGLRPPRSPPPHPALCAPSARRQAPAAGAKRLAGRRGAAAHNGAARRSAEPRGQGRELQPLLLPAAARRGGWRSPAAALVGSGAGRAEAPLTPRCALSRAGRRRFDFIPAVMPWGSPHPSAFLLPLAGLAAEPVGFLAS